MKGIEKRFLLILVVVVVVIIVVLLATRGKKEEAETQEDAGVISTVQELEDGTKLNISEKLNDIKTVEGLEVGEIQVTEKDGMSQILANVVNNTTGELGGFTVDITFTDKNGNVIITVPGYIKKLKPGEETQLNTTATVDFVETYDVTITKAK